MYQRCNASQTDVMRTQAIWLTKGCPNHLLNVIAHIVDTFAETPNMVPINERYDKLKFLTTIRDSHISLFTSCLLQLIYQYFSTGDNSMFIVSMSLEIVLGICTHVTTVTS